MAFSSGGVSDGVVGEPVPREDASDNSRFGFPVEHQVYLAMTSRLALHGFSRLGCPLDSLVGGAVTYAMPVAPNVWIVPSAGVDVQSTAVRGAVYRRAISASI
jgi:hypothetical protein